VSTECVLLRLGVRTARSFYRIVFEQINDDEENALDLLAKHSFIHSCIK